MEAWLATCYREWLIRIFDRYKLAFFAPLSRGQPQSAVCECKELQTADLMVEYCACASADGSYCLERVSVSIGHQGEGVCV